MELAGGFGGRRRRRPFEGGDFTRGEMPPLARLQAAQLKAADAHANDAYDGQAELQAGLADLALAAFAQHYPQPGAFARRFDDVDMGGCSAVSVFQDNAAPPGSQLLVIRPVRNQDAVFLLVAVARVGQQVGQIAVVGEQDQAFAIYIQAADRVKTHRQIDEIDHGLASIIGRLSSRENIAGFVDGDVCRRLRGVHRVAIHIDPVAYGVGFTAQDGALPVDGHTPGGDQVFAGSP